MKNINYNLREKKNHPSTVKKEGAFIFPISITWFLKYPYLRMCCRLPNDENIPTKRAFPKFEVFNLFVPTESRFSHALLKVSSGPSFMPSTCLCLPATLPEAFGSFGGCRNIPLSFWRSPGCVAGYLVCVKTVVTEHTTPIHQSKLKSHKS